MLFLLQGMMNMKDKKNLIILALLLVMVVMSYGFVSYSTRAIEESHSSKIKKWDVAITNVETLISGEAESGNIKYSEGKNEEHDALLAIYNFHPIVVNYQQVREEVISLLKQIKDILSD